MLCWLYFDIEYSREANPEIELEVVMAAFHKILESFARCSFTQSSASEQS